MSRGAGATEPLHIIRQTLVVLCVMPACGFACAEKEDHSCKKSVQEAVFCLG